MDNLYFLQNGLMYVLKKGNNSMGNKALIQIFDSVLKIGQNENLRIILPSLSSIIRIWK